MARLAESMQDDWEPEGEWEPDWEVSSIEDPEEEKRKQEAEDQKAKEKQKQADDRKAQQEAQQKHVEKLTDIQGKAGDILKQVHQASKDAGSAAKDALKDIKQIARDADASAKQAEKALAAAQKMIEAATKISEGAGNEATKTAASLEKMNKSIGGLIDKLTELSQRVAAIEAVISIPKEAQQPMMAPIVTNNIDGIRELVESNQQVVGVVGTLIKGIQAPKRIVRDRNGYATGIETA